MKVMLGWLFCKIGFVSYKKIKRFFCVVLIIERNNVILIYRKVIKCMCVCVFEVNNIMIVKGLDFNFLLNI